MITAIVKGFYPYFLPLVIYGIFLRVHEKKWSMAETILLIVFFGHVVLMLLQIVIGGGDFSRRYLLPAVPLLFGWAGYALHHLSSRRYFHWIAIVCMLFLLQDALRPSLEPLWKARKKDELSVVHNLSSVIRKDWSGKPSFYSPEIYWDEYRSPKRPLVQCDSFPGVGYASGGSGISGGNPALPLPDYRIFENNPVEVPYIEIGHCVCADRIYRVGKLVK